MHKQWVSCSASLPHDGDPIHFQLSDRDVPLDGTYTNGVFHSRWSDYDVGRVRLWSSLNIDAIMAAAARTINAISIELAVLPSNPQEQAS
ncbi:MAG: hypothetical protein ABIQ70_03385 [Dokdonella sp.]